MFLYFDKQGTLKTAIPHGKPVRQGDDLQLVVCLDSDFFTDVVTKDNWSLQLFLTLPNGKDALSTAILPTKIPTSTTVFKKTVDSEITYDLVDGTAYWMYEFDIPASQSTVYDGNLIANIKFLKQNLTSDGTVSITFTDSPCIGPNGTATRTFTSVAGQDITAGDVLTIGDSKAQVYVVDTSSPTYTYKAVFLVSSLFYSATTNQAVSAVLNRLSTATVRFTGRASIYIETTLGGATTEIDESALHYENLLKQISYLSTMLQNGNSIYMYDGNISFTGDIASVALNNISVPTGKKLLLNDIVLDKKGQVGRVTVIYQDTKNVILSFYTAFASCQLYSYSISGKALDTLTDAYTLPATISDLSSLTGVREPIKGDIVLVKYATANKYGQSTAFGYISGITGTSITITLLALIEGQDGPVTYYLNGTSLNISGLSSSTAPNILPSADAVTISYNAKYKKGDYIIAVFEKENIHLQKTIFLTIATDITPNQSISLYPIAFLDGQQGIRGNGIRTGSTVPTYTATDLVGDLYLNTTNYDLYKLDKDSSGVPEWGKIGNIRGEKGSTGETGNGIRKVEKTNTDGLVDTYTITYTDNTTTTFTVTNGKDGKDGADGKGLNDISQIGADGATETTIGNDGISVTDALKIITSDESYDIPLSYKIPISQGNCIVFEKEAGSSIVKISIDASKTTDTPSATNRLTTETYVKNVVSNIKTSFVVKASENAVFKSTQKTITLTAPFVDNQGTTVQLSDLALGENIYIEESQYSDRWVSNIVKVGDTVTSVVLTELKQDKAPVTDVQINGATILDNGVAKIPKASSTDLGVIKAGSGLETTSDGAMSTKSATDDELKAKTNGNNVIVPKNLDKAVKEGLGNSDLTWETEYKRKARETIDAQENLTAGNGITIADGVISAYGDVAFEEEQTSSLPVIYEITKNVVNGYANGSSTVESTTDSVAITIIPDSGYSLPATVVVTGATQNYNSSTGVLTLTNLTGDVTVSAVCSE